MCQSNNSWNLNSLKVLPLSIKNIKECKELAEIALNGMWSKNNWEKELQNSLRLSIGIFNTSKLIAIACGSVIFDELHLTSLCVHPEHRGKGIGKLVLKSLLTKAKQKGAAFATLEVATDNCAAKKLYKAFGFKTKGYRKDYYRDGKTALIQWATLE